MSFTYTTTAGVAGDTRSVAAKRFEALARQVSWIERHGLPFALYPDVLLEMSALNALAKRRTQRR